MGSPADPHPPRFSILIPSFNAAAYIEATLRSVRKQMFPSLEVIVMDGGSKDGTVEVARGFAGLEIRIVSEPDKGQLHAVQKAARLARGDILYWLNADDILLPGSLAAVDAAFREDPSLDLVFSDDFAFSEDHGTLVNGGLIKGLSYLDHSLYYRQMYSECIFWRREKTSYLPDSDYDLRVATDYAFFLNLRHGLKERWLPKRLGAFRVVADQVSQRERSKLAAEFDRIRQDAYRRVGWSATEVARRRRAHWLSFQVRQVIRPGIYALGRALRRKLDQSRHRRRMTAAFFDWLATETPPTPALEKLLHR